MAKRKSKQREPAIADVRLSSDMTWQPPIQTGAVVPIDMTVRLVRSENATIETFLTIVFSITLSLFGVFLSPWITDPSGTALLTKLAVIGFAAVSAILIIWWARIRIGNARKGVTVPLNLLGAVSDIKEK